MTDIDELYRAYLLHQAGDYTDEQQNKTPLGLEWSCSFWEERYDNITPEEYEETKQIHERHRKTLIDELRGKNNG